MTCSVSVQPTARSPTFRVVRTVRLRAPVTGKVRLSWLPDRLPEPRNRSIHLRLLSPYTLSRSAIRCSRLVGTVPDLGFSFVSHDGERRQAAVNETGIKTALVAPELSAAAKSRAARRRPDVTAYATRRATPSALVNHALALVLARSLVMGRPAHDPLRTARPGPGPAQGGAGRSSGGWR